MTMIDDVIQLHNHLTHNFYPPIPHAAKCAKEAIDAVNAGEHDKEIETPSGRKMLACEVIEELHLDYFIDQEMYWWE